MSRVLVAMSGGVDSSLAAALLVEAGHEVIGVTMKTFCYSGTPADGKTCCGLDGIVDARRVATTLGVPHYVFDVEEDFTRDVIDDFVAEYAQGRTPNPCVRCNGNTKFRDLLARGEALGCDRIASGHYARIMQRPDGGVALARGLDAAKDQAYFLWGLPADMLPRLLFPLGELTKTEVRARARELGLATADKAESQEICFVPTGNYRDLLEKKLAPTHPALRPGRLVRRSGEVVGTHAGYGGFTVGQRRGLGGGFEEPLFVLEVRPDTRDVVVGTRDELFRDQVVVGELNWLGDPPAEGLHVHVQLRHRAPAVPAIVGYAGGFGGGRDGEFGDARGGGFEGGRSGEFGGGRDGGFGGDRDGGFEGGRSGEFGGGRSGEFGGDRSGEFGGDRSGEFGRGRDAGFGGDRGGEFGGGRAGEAGGRRAGYGHGGDGPEAPLLTLSLVEPQTAVTPGQSAVVFLDDRVLGGGRIVGAEVAAPV